MSRILIEAFPKISKDFPETNKILEVSEFFTDTIQGENFVGWPATFLRLQHCTLNCVYCDTQEVWRQGNPYTFNELFKLMEETKVIEQLATMYHVFVITGGSPLRQQNALIGFFEEFKNRYNFLPNIEIENECTIRPRLELVQIVNCWNNSPKLESSGNSHVSRYKPSIIAFLSTLPNSWFKFVVEKETDWEEIQRDFIDTKLIKKEQIVLMPLGETRSEIQQTQNVCIDLAINHHVRYTPRLHIDLWDKKTGV